jgi:UDPglucose--hexose-1-phosphate uridylyltransferase
MSDEQIEEVLTVYAQRIADLKRDRRFKYVTVFKNQGVVGGAEWEHSHSQVTATTFVPRRILYELRSSRTWFEQKERCVFCDIVHQEEKRGKRMVDVQGSYFAFCPYASRVPYEIWLMSRKHNHLFEQPRPGANRRDLAALLGRVLRRIEKLTKDYHMVVHTAPNAASSKGEIAKYWTTIAEDYHWHIEILPIVESRSKSYSIKEVYFNPLEPEVAAEELRALDPGL